MKNKWLAAALNLIPGIGYIYIGETRIVFGVLLLLSLLTSIAVASIDSALNVDIGGFTLWDLVPCLVSEAAFVTDAFIEAKRINKAHVKK